MTTMTDTIRVGRPEVTRGLTATPVTIEGRAFAEDTRGRLLEACGRCSPAWSGSVEYYGHVYAGVCFECAGFGYRKTYPDRAAAEKVLARRAKDKARRERKAEAERLAKVAARDQWAAEYPTVAADLAAVRAVDASDNDAGVSRFLADLAAQSTWKALSPAQTEAVANAAQEFLLGYVAAKLTEAVVAKARRYADVEVGQKGVAVTGTVAVAMTIETYYGNSRLVIVEGTGDDSGVTAKMFGTGETLWEATRGDEVTVVGTVKDLEVYQGTPQTVLTRAKITTLTKAPE